MRTTIDSSGRVVIPKPLRDALGLVQCEVELTPDGAGVRIEPVLGSGTVERRGRLVIDSDVRLDDDESARFVSLITGETDRNSQLQGSGSLRPGGGVVVR